MSHPIRTTDAIMISLETEGEANVVAHCLTRDLGRIYLHVQGAWNIQNKHRMMLFPLASVTIDCVEGLHVIRCTGVTEREVVYDDLINLSKVRRGMIDQVVHVIRRLVPVHNPVPGVFETFEMFYQLALSEVPEESLQILMLITELRILGILGYWNSDWTDEVLSSTGKTYEYVTNNKRSVEKLVQRIIGETQMHVHNKNQQ